MSKKIILIALTLVAVLALTGCAQSILPGTTWYTADSYNGTITFNRNASLTYSVVDSGYTFTMTGGNWYANNNSLTLKVSFNLGGYNISYDKTYNVKISGKNLNFYDENGAFSHSWYRK